MAQASMGTHKEDFVQAFRPAQLSPTLEQKTKPEACPNRYRVIQEVCEKVNAERQDNGLEELNFND